MDRAGTPEWDYHTAGAGIGIRSADGKIKKTATTGEYETLLSRRQYLYDASFLVALHGDPATVCHCADALMDPEWPVFLGRKCCVPTEPVFAGTGEFESLTHALQSVPWFPRTTTDKHQDRSPTRTLDAIIEHPPGSPPPPGARMVYDVPRVFGFSSHGPRWVVADRVVVPVGEPAPAWLDQPSAWRDPYGPEWDALRQARLEHDNYVCVFCKSPATEVHHLDYGDVRPETLRSVCDICHDACTMLEYGRDMHQRRIDPADATLRLEILRQIDQLLSQRRMTRRRKLLESGRRLSVNTFDEVPSSWTSEGR